MPKHPPIQRSPQERTQPKHKFAVGQTVRVTARPFELAAQGSYRVISQLPGEGGEFGYRVKSASEVHERVVRESQLSR